MTMSSAGIEVSCFLFHFPHSSSSFPFIGIGYPPVRSPVHEFTLFAGSRVHSQPFVSQSRRERKVFTADYLLPTMNYCLPRSQSPSPPTILQSSIIKKGPPFGLRAAYIGFAPTNGSPLRGSASPKSRKGLTQGRKERKGFRSSKFPRTCGVPKVRCLLPTHPQSSSPSPFRVLAL